MRSENVSRGSWRHWCRGRDRLRRKQIDSTQNIVHVENDEARDFQPPPPFQLIGRPYIDQGGDFALHKRPGECGSLQNEQDPDRDRGGAPARIPPRASQASFHGPRVVERKFRADR